MKTLYNIIMACLIIATATCTATAQSISLGHTTPAASTAHAGGLSYTYSIGHIGRLVVTKPITPDADDTQAKPNANPAGKHLTATAYPNPCTEYLTIKTGDIASANAKIQIIDSKGSTIGTAETAISDNGELTIDVSSLAQGKYIIRIITNYCTYTATAIKI
ncbi:MAG: T9SS type A sorting domain-containing protein [Bacteroidales bacterium]|nr:T9SS type A sorting domain-containing protein [Bacteroidales bacterium]